MKPRKRHLTARIKPATKHALMAQLALAADGLTVAAWRIESARRECEMYRKLWVAALEKEQARMLEAINRSLNRPWYARLMWWRK